MNSITNKVVNKTTNKVSNSFFPQVDTDTSGWLIVDGKEYEIKHFNISFAQSGDHKGQPQSEVKGGRMLITLTQTLPDSMYYWAMKTQAKNGEVVFRSKTANAPLKVEFTNAYCVNLERDVCTYSGLTTNLVISPEKLVINGIEFDNHWVK